MSTAQLTRLAPGRYALKGKLTFHTVNDVLAQHAKIFEDNTSSAIDLAEVEQVDSAGLALLVELIKRAKALNITLGFANASEQMQALVKVNGLTAIIPLDVADVKQ